MNRSWERAKCEEDDTFCVRSGNVTGSHFSARYRAKALWARGRHAEDMPLVPRICLKGDCWDCDTRNGPCWDEDWTTAV